MVVNNDLKMFSDVDDKLYNSQFTNHVVISLKDYEAMKEEIRSLIAERDNIRNKYEYLEKYVESVRLPVDIIADGRVKRSEYYVETNPMSREVKYTVEVTVNKEDVLRYGHEY